MSVGVLGVCYPLASSFGLAAGLATEKPGAKSGPKRGATLTGGLACGAMVDAITEAERARFQAEAIAAIEVTGNLGWWELVNYYRAMAVP
jgi:hypothetical protein